VPVQHTVGGAAPVLAALAHQSRSRQQSGHRHLARARAACFEPPLPENPPAV
jgi:hypothetical protein